VRPFLAARGVPDPDIARLGAAVPTIRQRARSLVEAAEMLDYYFREPPVMEDTAKALLTPDAAPRLAALRDICASTEPFVATELEARAKAWIESAGLKMRDVAQAMRVALTGRIASPGLFDVAVVLGRELTLARLDRGIRIAQGG
jgi:glutamyl-tRNA synthetase